MKRNDDLDIFNPRGWYAVRLYSRSNPSVGTSLTLLLDEPVEVRTRKQWRNFLGALKELEAKGGMKHIKTGGFSKFIQNYLDKYVKDFPGVYSIGPFETQDRAVQAVYETDDWWKKNAAQFVGSEGVPQYVPDYGTREYKPSRKTSKVVTGNGSEDGDETGYGMGVTAGRLGEMLYSKDDWLSVRKRKTLGVIDVTDPENWVHYTNVAECAKALGISASQVSAVCKGKDGRTKVKGRVLRYADPAGYRVPVVVRDYGDGELDYEPDLETIRNGQKKPTGGTLREPAPAVPSNVDWGRGDRVRFSNLARL